MVTNEEVGLIMKEVTIDEVRNDCYLVPYKTYNIMNNDEWKNDRERNDSKGRKWDDE